MRIFNSTHDLFLALYRADLFNRLGTVLDGFETTRRDSPFAEGLNFTCTHFGTCTSCLAGRVTIHPCPGAFSVTVPRVSGDRWKTALGAIVPVPGSARHAVRDPFALGPLDGVPGWERLTAFVPGTTVGHLSLHTGISGGRLHPRPEDSPDTLLRRLPRRRSRSGRARPRQPRTLPCLPALTSAACPHEEAGPTPPGPRPRTHAGPRAGRAARAHC